MMLARELVFVDLHQRLSSVWRLMTKKENPKVVDDNNPKSTIEFANKQ